MSDVDMETEVRRLERDMGEVQDTIRDLERRVDIAEERGKRLAAFLQSIASERHDAEEHHRSFSECTHGLCREANEL